MEKTNSAPAGAAELNTVTGGSRRPPSDALLHLAAPTPLPLLAALLSLVLGGMAIWRIFMVTGPAGPGLSWLAAISALVSFTVATLNWNKATLGRWSNPLAALLVELLLLNVLASFAIAGDTRYFTLFMVISLGLAGWLLEPRWFFLTWMAGVVAWLTIAMMADRPWETQLARVAGGFALSTLLLIAKQVVWQRHQQLIIQEAEERRELDQLRGAAQNHRVELRRLEAELARTHARTERLTQAAGEMLSEHDEEGRFLYVSPACKVLLGASPTALSGQTLASLVAKEDLAAVETARRAVLEQGETQPVSLRLRRSDGSHVWVEITLCAVPASDVRPLLRFVAATRNCTALRELEADWAAAEREQQRLEARLTAAEEEQQRLEAAWQAADASRLQAHQLRQLAEDERRQESQARAEAEAARLRLETQVEELQTELARLRTQPVVAVAPVPLPAARFLDTDWSVEADRLVQERRRLELDLDHAAARQRQLEAEIDRLQAEKRRLEMELDQERAARQRFDTAQRLAEETLREHENAHRRLEAELKAAKSECQQLQTEVHAAEVQRQQFEKDRLRLKAQLSQLEQDLLAGQQLTEEEQRGRMEQQKLVEQLRQAVHHAEAERKRANDSARRNTDQLQSMLSELPVMLVIWDASGNLVRQCGGGFELVGWQADAAAGASLESLAMGNSSLAAALRDVQSGQDYSYDLEREGRHLRVRCTPWRIEDGMVRGLLGLVLDTTAQRRAEAQAKERARTTASVASTTDSRAQIRLLQCDPIEPEPQFDGPLPRFAGKALLVDDRREPQRVMTFLLERFGLDVEIADFPDQAEDLAASGRFDLVFLARSMLRKESDLARKFRTRGLAAPILGLLEAEASPTQEARCRELGCDAVLRLPLNPPRLAEVLHSYLSEAKEDPTDSNLELPLLSRHRNDPAFAGLIKGFVDDLPTKIAELWSALCVADLAQLVKGVHQLKEAATLYGYPEVAQQAARLEQAVLDGQAAAALRTELKELERLTRRCERGLAA